MHISNNNLIFVVSNLKLLQNIMERNYNLAKHLFNGLTVLDYANDLIPALVLIQSNRSYIKPIQNRTELTAWVIKNQMFTNEYYPDLVNYLADKFNIPYQ